MSETPKWYVVHTYSGYENKVAQNIEKVVENQGFGDRIFEVRVPTEEVVEYKDGKKKTVERKTYPGYVLVKMIQTPESWYVVRNIRGVTGFVGSTTEPIPLTEQEVAALAVENKTVQVNFVVGDTVEVVRGSFAEYKGVVEEILPEENLVRLSIHFFGRDTSYEIPLGDVKGVEE